MRRPLIRSHTLSWLKNFAALSLMGMFAHFWSLTFATGINLHKSTGRNFFHVLAVYRRAPYWVPLFLGFVNDLPSIFLDSMVWLFADDIKILFTNLNFHDDLWLLYSWNIYNGMIANACKAKCLHFNGSAKISTTQHEVLENVSSQRDLGLYIINDLKWGLHVTSKLCKARQCLKAKIPFNTPSPVKLHLYRSLVPSVLLYWFPAWYPDVYMLKKLEKFLRSCFLWIFGRKSSYLKQLKDNNFLPFCY